MKTVTETFDLGDAVLCDMCDEDYSNSTDKGGLTFGSKAVCPKCVPRVEASAKKYGEEWNIKNRCPADKSFAEWVREDLRGGKPATMTITSW